MHIGVCVTSRRIYVKVLKYYVHILYVPLNNLKFFNEKILFFIKITLLKYLVNNNFPGISQVCGLSDSCMWGSHMYIHN